MCVSVSLSVAEVEVHEGSKAHGGVHVTRRQVTGP